MADSVRFLFDPRCPWCFQTARWMRRLEQLGETAVTWAVFSLSIANQKEGHEAAADRDAAPALRTAIALRSAEGNDAVGRFYLALAEAIHLHGRDCDDPSVIEAALTQAGADPGVLRSALDDPSTWEAVQREHGEAVREHGAFGVPTIVLDGHAIFGPVINDVPSDGEARELWSHVRWLVRNDTFAELKRGRARLRLRQASDGAPSTSGADSRAA